MLPRPRPLPREKRVCCTKAEVDVAIPESSFLPLTRLENDISKGEPSTERHLTQRLKEAEQKLAEKDHRIGLLEGRGALLLQRLLEAERRLAEADHRAEQRPQKQEEPTRLLVKMRSQGPFASRESLVSTCASTGTTTPGTPKTPCLRRQVWSMSSLSERHSHVEVDATDTERSPDVYATAADLEAVCCRSESLLRAMSAAVSGEPHSPRQRTRVAKASPRRPAGKIPAGRTRPMTHSPSGGGVPRGRRGLSTATGTSRAWVQGTGSPTVHSRTTAATPKASHAGLDCAHIAFHGSGPKSMLTWAAVQERVFTEVTASSSSGDEE